MKLDYKNTNNQSEKQNTNKVTQILFKLKIFCKFWGPNIRLVINVK
jgi:hypothetical protein